MSTTAGIPATACEVRIVETGETWWRAYGGRFDGLWTRDDGSTMPSYGGAYRSSSWLASSGTVRVVAHDHELVVGANCPGVLLPSADG